jgi:hypothetical protein
MNQIHARIECMLCLLQLSLFDKKQESKRRDSKRQYSRSLFDEVRVSTPQTTVSSSVTPPPVREVLKKTPSPQVVEQKKEEPPKEEHPKIVPTFIPFLNTLSEKPKMREERSFEHYKSIFEKQGISLDPNRTVAQKPAKWQEAVPHIMIITAFTKGSSKELFIQKVALALTERLKKAVFVTTCNKEAAGASVAFASTGLIEAIIVASDFQTKKEILSWMGCLPTNTTEKLKPPLECSLQVFTTPLYELFIPNDGEHTASFKSELWKALQSL